MLPSTFCHLNGVTEEFESELWARGVRSWSDALNDSLTFLPAHKRERLCEGAQQSVERLAQRDIDFFASRLEHKHHWRLLPHLQNPAFLDIETTGLGYRALVTVVGVCDSERNVTHFVRGKNLGDFNEFIHGFDSLVTFNGTTFDLPFLKRALDSNFDGAPHVDLRYALRAAGYVGGLKKIEVALSISRAEETQGLTGWDAVRLWRQYERGDEGSLELLLKYNEEDIANLIPLAKIAYKENKAKLFLD